MKGKVNLSIMIIFLHLVLFNAAFSQKDTSRNSPVRITLKDDSELIGEIVERDSISTLFRTLSDITISIPNNQIIKIDLLNGEISGKKFFRRDPNNTRLLFAPTARALTPGQGYFSTYQIFFPMIAIGLANYLNIAGGVSLVPGGTQQLLYFAPKVIFLNKEDISFAGGMLLTNLGISEWDINGLYYSVLTFGKRRISGTVGLGWGFTGNEVNENPIIMLGFEYQISNSSKLVSENWIFPNSDFHLLSFAFRFFGEKLAADFGLIHPLGAEISGFPFIPWVGFAYNFNTLAR